MPLRVTTPVSLMASERRESNSRTRSPSGVQQVRLTGRWRSLSGDCHRQFNIKSVFYRSQLIPKRNLFYIMFGLTTSVIIANINKDV
jgi:hypothetical protein